MADDTGEQEFEILEALAKTSARDFRLGQFMRELGMDDRQPILLYRALIKEAHENEAFIDTLLKDVFGKEEIISQLRADALAKDQEIKRLRARINKLEAQASHKQSEKQELEVAASELQEDANSHNLLKEFLQGRVHPKTVEGLYRLFYQTHMAQLTDIGRQPPSDPGRLDKIEERLRQELRDILHIPKQELEKENEKLRAENVELLRNNKALAAVNWAEYQQGLIDKSRNETTEGGGIEGAG